LLVKSNQNLVSWNLDKTYLARNKTHNQNLLNRVLDDIRYTGRDYLLVPTEGKKDNVVEGKDGFLVSAKCAASATWYYVRVQLYISQQVKCIFVLRFLLALPYGNSFFCNWKLFFVIFMFVKGNSTQINNNFYFFCI
jgi:hypothetical protein